MMKQKSYTGTPWFYIKIIRQSKLQKQRGATSLTQIFLSRRLTKWKPFDSLYTIHIFNTAASNNWNASKTIWGKKIQ